MPTRPINSTDASGFVTVLYFANLAEQAGKDEEQLAIDGRNISQLYQHLQSKYGFKLRPQQLAIAINHTISDWNAPLQHGDIVAFIPPVAGG